MGKRPSIEDQIRTELAAYLKTDVENVQLEHSLRDDLRLDSMGTIELVFRIEEAFDLQIPDDDLPNLVTVGDVIKYVEGKTRPASARPAPKKSTARSTAKKKR